MEKKYLIQSTNYHTSERQTKKGKVYDIRFWIIDSEGKKLHKQLSGFATKKLAKEGFAEFVNENCTLVKGSPLRKVNAKKDELVFKDLYDQYTKAMSNQLKDATIYEKQKLFELIILPEFADIKMKDLTRTRLLTWQDELWARKNEKKASTTLISIYLKYARTSPLFFRGVRTDTPTTFIIGYWKSESRNAASGKFLRS